MQMFPPQLQVTMAPFVIRVVSVQIDSKLGKLQTAIGISPVNNVPAVAMYCKLVAMANSFGSVPTMLVANRSSVSNIDNFPISVGRMPDSPSACPAKKWAAYVQQGETATV